MTAGLNLITILGNVGGEVNLHYSPEGVAVSSFSVAVNGFKEGDVEWFRIVTFKQTAELANTALHAGSKVLVTGRMKTREYMKDEVKHKVTELLANNIILLDKKPAAETEGEAPEGDPEPEPELFSEADEKTIAAARALLAKTDKKPAPKVIAKPAPPKAKTAAKN